MAQRVFQDYLTGWRRNDIDRQAQVAGIVSGVQGPGAIAVVAGGIAAGPLSDQVQQLVDSLVSK